MRLIHGTFGPFYGCKRWKPNQKGCRGTRNLNRDGSLKKSVDQSTRVARIRAHRAFDPLWASGGMTRGEAYRWLAGMMGVEVVHIGELSKEQCEDVIELVAARREEAKRR
jgi:hypothetical protein